MSRRIDYVHAAVLTALEGVRKSSEAVRPYRDIDLDIPAGANVGVFEASIALAKANVALDAAERAITEWKVEHGEMTLAESITGIKPRGSK